VVDSEEEAEGGDSNDPSDVKAIGGNDASCLAAEPLNELQMDLR